MNMLEELMKRGYSLKLSGTWYLACAANMERKASRPLMTSKEVYPAIAKTAGTTPQAVEKSIRDSIKRVEPDRTNTEVIRELGWMNRQYED